MEVNVSGGLETGAQFDGVGRSHGGELPVLAVL